MAQQTAWYPNELALGQSRPKVLLLCTGTALTVPVYVLPAYLAEMNVKRLCKAWDAFLSGDMPPKLRAGTSIDLNSSNQKTGWQVQQY
jgi:hypothetical protein